MVIKNTDTTVGTNKKLVPKYRGPYKISRVFLNDRYEVVDIENCQLTQIPYRGVLDSTRIKPWIRIRDDMISTCS